MALESLYFLSNLAELNIQAKLRNGKIVLAPKNLITPKIVNVVNKNRNAIIDEINQLENYNLKTNLETNLKPISKSWPFNTFDPRPELTSDSELWKKLLLLAFNQKSSLLGALHGFRCCGCRIKRFVTGYALSYDPDLNDYWPDKQAFDADIKLWLRSEDDVVSRSKSELTELLKLLSTAY